jgi:hypothetical protein
VLLLILPAAVLFHPVPGARAVLFFTFGYFLTTAIYSLGYFAEYETRYHPLIFASVVTIILYHSLDITPHIMVAWVAESILIALNALMIWNAGVSTMLHWQITVAINAFVLIILLGGWGHGMGRVLYNRLFDLDIPLGFIGSEYRFAGKKNQAKKEIGR